MSTDTSAWRTVDNPSPRQMAADAPFLEAAAAAGVTEVTRGWPWSRRTYVFRPGIEVVIRVVDNFSGPLREIQRNVLELPHDRGTCYWYNPADGTEGYGTPLFNDCPIHGSTLTAPAEGSTDA